MLPKTEKNLRPKSQNVGDEVQIDFAGSFSDEEGKKRFIALAIYNCTRWPFAIVCKKCNTDSALEFLTIICENIGLPRKLKWDNRTAFKSRKFKKIKYEFSILTEFSTPYVHTSIGLVERNIRTLESYIKPFLLENNTLKQAVRRAIKLMRFSESVPLKMSPFEKLTGCKPRNRITNNLGLDNPDSTQVTLVESPNEQLLGSQRLDALQFADFESSRTWGRSRNE